MHQANERKIGVVHLVWLPYGLDLFKNFVNSYAELNAGYDHELLIIFNGVEVKEDTNPYHEYISAFHIKYESLYISSGQDLECYFRAAEKLSTDYILMMNSYSVVLNDNWLKKYVDGFSHSTIGVIAATASNQSYYSSVFKEGSPMLRPGKGVIYSFNKYKLFIKAFFYWRFLFKPFPNPHVRTNAFMINRKVFLDLKHKPFTSKFNAYLFESGRNSLTNQLLKSGYKVFVIDRNGKTYEPPEWKSSKTFWIANQENLLVSDNQTDLYIKSNQEIKSKLTELAWGK